MSVTINGRMLGGVNVEPGGAKGDPGEKIRTAINGVSSEFKALLDERRDLLGSVARITEELEASRRQAKELRDRLSGSESAIRDLRNELNVSTAAAIVEREAAVKAANAERDAAVALAKETGVSHSRMVCELAGAASRIRELEATLSVEKERSANLLAQLDAAKNSSAAVEPSQEEERPDPPRARSYSLRDASWRAHGRQVLVELADICDSKPDGLKAAFVVEAWEARSNPRLTRALDVAFDSRVDSFRVASFLSLCADSVAKGIDQDVVGGYHVERVSRYPAKTGMWIVGRTAAALDAAGNAT